MDARSFLNLRRSSLNPFRSSLNLVRSSLNRLRADSNLGANCVRGIHRKSAYRSGAFDFRLLLVVAILLAVALGAVFYFWPVDNALSIDPQRAREAIELAYQANGAIENEGFSVGENERGEMIFGFDQAIDRYEKIQQMFPDQELAYRNLAIARALKLQAFQSQDGSQPSQSDDAAAVAAVAAEAEALNAARTQAIETIEKLSEKFDSAESHWIVGYLLMMLNVNRETQLKIPGEYLQAARRSPDHAPFWYDVYDSIVLKLQVPGMENESDEALENLRRLQPENLFVVCHSLNQKAAKQSDDFAEYFRQSRPVLEQANFATREYQGKDMLFADVSDLLEKIDAAIASDNFSDLQSLTGSLLSELFSRDPFKVDVEELKPNPLDYLVRSFSPEIHQAAASLPITFADTVDVRFAEMAVPPALAEAAVIGLSLVDFNFDGVQDLCVLRQDRVEFLAGPVTSLGDQVVAQFPLESEFVGVQAAFLLTIGDSGSGADRKIRASFSNPTLEGDASESNVTTVAELPQILLWGPTGLKVLQLEWSLEDGFQIAAVEQPESLAAVTKIHSLQLLDFDQDADLDAAVVTDQGLRFLMNRSNNTFVDSSQWSLMPERLSPDAQMQIVDWDRDLDIDLLIRQGDGSMGLMENYRHGSFRWKSFASPAPLALDTDQPRVGFAVAELDGNASWDLVLGDASQTSIQFTETKSWSTVDFLPVATDTVPRLPGRLVGNWQVGDFDNSGTQDLLLLDNGQLKFHPASFVGNALDVGQQAYTLGEATFFTALETPTWGERFDLDNDGDLDLLLIVDGRVRVFSNEGGNANGWISVVPRGRGDNVSKVNHLGLGSLLEARIGDHYFAETVTRPAVHIGLGQAERADLARIIWPNGIPQVLLLPAGEQRVAMMYILKGSCPLIYYYDGQQWEFFSDCLWAAPIGLQSAAGGLAPTRNWEYLRLPPDTLREAGGTYRVMLTEELWEAGYFDCVRLQTIDHPLGTEIHTNDKVGPPAIVQPRLFQIRQKNPPVSATNQWGRDVLPELLQEDQVYVKSFEQRYAQGFVESHELILDLGPEATDQRTLFLTGWIQPTDTSINVLLRQHPETNGPEFPAMFVMDAEGNWQAASRAMGFPGGKTKTMTVPLDGLFPSADHRLKIVTSCEIYWDQIYTATDESPYSYVVQESPLAMAKTFFRGTSRRLPSRLNGPERFDANDVSDAAVWPPMSGPFTNYGDVLSLLLEEDDQLVVIGTGDAIELRFQTPAAAVPSGYQRSFLLYNVGYDKDADLNTVEGQSSLPLPQAAMPAYPVLPSPLLPSPADPAEQSLSEKSMQRHQSWNRFWHQVANPHLKSPVEETKVPRQ